MNSPNSAHLTNDQFVELLLGAPADSESASHLAQCDHCRQQLSLFESSVTGFHKASLGWSEAHSNTLPAVAPPPAHHAIFAPLRWAAASVMLLLLAVPVWKHSHPAAPPADLASLSDDSPAQIAEDNDLLQSVHTALNANEISPLHEYRLADGPHSAPKHMRN